MKLLRNTKTSLKHPKLAWNYVHHQSSRLINAGQAVRLFSSGIQIRGWIGLSEFHSVERYITPAESHFLQTFPFETGELVDVGANLGVISLTLAKRFPSQKLQAFAPNPSTFEALQQNMTLNQCSIIKAQPLFVVDRDDNISFEANPIHRGKTHVATTGQFLTEFPCITLDTYAKQEEISSIAFLKVDIKGYKEQVFCNASELLKQQRIHIIYYEVYLDNARRKNLESEAPTRFLQDHGYTIYKFGSKASLHPIKDYDVNQFVLENWIALRVNSKQILHGYIFGS